LQGWSKEDALRGYTAQMEKVLPDWEQHPKLADYKLE